MVKGEGGRYFYILNQVQIIYCYGKSMYCRPTRGIVGVVVVTRGRSFGKEENMKERYRKEIDVP